MLGRLALFLRGGFISIPSWCQVHIHDTFLSLSPPLSPASIHQSCNPVVFAERIRMCPWQRMKEKSTGIKFQCNCLLNCGLQLLKFYPWFCVTTAVMNSVWLWVSHWRHAHFELEKRWVGGGVWDWGLDLGEWGWRADLVRPKGLTLSTDTRWHTLSTYWSDNTSPLVFVAILSHLIP